MVQLLLQARADPTLLDRYGNSLLHLALQAGDEEMLRTLLAHLGSAAPYLLRLPNFHGEWGWETIVRSPLVLLWTQPESC